MDYEFYKDFLESQQDLDVYNREIEFFGGDDFDTDIWARLDVNTGDRKYRLTFKEDSSPNAGRSNYKFNISRKDPLNIEDGWTNWRRVDKFSYDGYRSESFERQVQEELSEILPVEFETEQKTL